MVDHVQGRAQMLLTLTEELVGPSPQGEPLDCNRDLAFSTPEAAHGPWRQMGTLDEILMRDAPSKRYGVGVLYPAEAVVDEPSADGPGNGASVGESLGPEQVLTEKARDTLEQVAKRSGRGGERDSDDFDLVGANNFKPSSLGVSFLAEFPAGSKLVVEVPSHRCENDRPVNGRYEPKRVRAGSSEWTWWLRRSVSFRAEATAEVLNGRLGRHVLPLLNGQGLGNLDLSVELFLRPQTDGDRRLVTVCLLNRKKAAGQNIDADCLFQVYFRVTVVTPDERASIFPYPTRAELHKLDEEEQSLALLYRRSETFAVGHGCAADWASLNDGRAKWVAAEVLPSFETPSSTSLAGIYNPVAKGFL